MNKRLKLTLTLFPFVAYAMFFTWYTNLSGPLTETEIQAVLKRMGTHSTTPGATARLEKFMREDDGREFFMLNASQQRDKPLRVGDVRVGESSQSVANRYSSYMLKTLIRRACLPIFAGRAVMPGMEAHGASNLGDWTHGAVMRYRSRRDLIEVISNPDFQGQYRYKMAALKKSMAFPTQPRLNLAEPRLLLALMALIAALLVRVFMS